MVVEAKFRGLPDFKAALAEIPRNLRRRALREALAAGGRLVRDEMRRRAPILKTTTHAGASALRRGVRAVGTVRKAIVVRTSKRDRSAGNVGVFVNVRPAKGSNAGAKSPRDPFYWRWLNFGWNPASGSSGGRLGRRGKRQRRQVISAKLRQGARFLEAGAGKLGDALQAFVARIGPAIAKFNKRK